MDAVSTQGSDSHRMRGGQNNLLVTRSNSYRRPINSSISDNQSIASIDSSIDSLSSVLTEDCDISFESNLSVESLSSDQQSDSDQMREVLRRPSRIEAIAPRIANALGRYAESESSDESRYIEGDSDVNSANAEYALLPSSAFSPSALARGFGIDNKTFFQFLHGNIVLDSTDPQWSRLYEYFRTELEEIMSIDRVAISDEVSQILSNPTIQKSLKLSLMEVAEQYKALLTAVRARIDERGLDNETDQIEQRNLPIDPDCLKIYYFLKQHYQETRNEAISSASHYSIGASGAMRINPAHDALKFKDVAGAKEAKSELSNIIHFLKNPENFHKVGAKMPKGFLLEGPPGNGKTLLAKAVAGESNVPFLQISGSGFDEIYVGTGAKRARALFQEARALGRAIIFIDEIDAIGRKRSGSDEDNHAQTLNQILIEMDGFNFNENIFVLAATNRCDVLDEALIRPGRFDRIITVPKPTAEERLAILTLYLNKISHDLVPANIEKLSTMTINYSGAELAGLVNHAALIAAVAHKDKATMADFEKALDKIKKNDGAPNMMYL